MNDRKTQRRVRKELRQTFKTLAREKKRCERLYSDWADDEFNMLDYHFEWGLPHNKVTEPVPSFCTYNKATVYYNRLTKLYYLDIDVECFDSIDKKRIAAYLDEIKDALGEWLVLNLHTPKELTLHDALNLAPTEASSLATLYQKFIVFCDLYKTL